MLTMLKFCKYIYIFIFEQNIHSLRFWGDFIYLNFCLGSVSKIKNEQFVYHQKQAIGLKIQVKCLGQNPLKL